MPLLKPHEDETYKLQKPKSGNSVGLGAQRRPRVRRGLYFGLLAVLGFLLGGGVLFIYIPGIAGLGNQVGIGGTVQDESDSSPLQGGNEPAIGKADELFKGADQTGAEGASLEPSALVTESADLRTLSMDNQQATTGSEDVALLFREAEAAFARQAWLEALGLYTEVHAINATYESNVVSEHLAIAYKHAALEMMQTNPENDAGLETARRYLREAVELNPADHIAAEESALLSRYLTSLRSLKIEEPSEALDLLLEIYGMRPNYLNGLAAQQLYNTYIALGDIAFRRGETDVARDVYERAVALGLEEMDAASVRLASMDELLELTPTPFPANLPTVQAAALERGLVPVLLPSPTPASLAEVTARAEYAAAVAVTTGTFTPEPEAYVTPILVVPSPPAENLATEVARAVEATAHASAILIPTNTPMPYNAVIGEYVYATPVPENMATAQAHAVIAEANLILYGSPTPLPWNAIVITSVPPPPTPLPTLPPTNTPLPLLMPLSELTATPTPQHTAAPPDTLPVELRNKIVFLSDRSGDVQTYLFDPNTGQISLVTQEWVYPMAQEQLGFSPDGKREAIVLADSQNVLQIQIRNHEFSTTHEVTAVRNVQNSSAMAYDPAWSPIGDTIVYVSSEFAGDEIYTIRLADRIPIRLTNNSWEWDKHPTWSPDGSQIVFYSNRETGRMQLWIMNADGSNQRNMSSNEYNDWDPIWTR